MVKAIVCGVSGRMGGLISRLILRDKNFSLAGAVEKDGHPEIGKEIEGVRVVSDLARIVEKCQVVIDFTEAEATMEHLAICRRAKTAMVIGTTGFNQEQRGRIKRMSREIPIFISPNMSLGVNLLFKLIKEASWYLKDYEVEIVETHHNRKKDAPSGTAKKIVEIIALDREKNPDKIIKYGRCGLAGKRNPEEIGIHSLRLANVVGEHTVIFANQGERIELTHQAHSREIFAQGALKAASFIVKQKPGLYNMENLL